MAIKVYTVSGAPRAWRVLLGLAFKKLDYSVKLLSVDAGDLKGEALLQLNPRGTVPVTVVDDVTLTDSIGTLAWLDRATPEHPLFGGTTEQAATIWNRTTDLADHLRDALDQLLSPIFFRGQTEADTALRDAAQKLDAEFRRLQGWLAEGPFLAGDAPSAVDAIAFPEVRLVQRAAETKTAVMRQLVLADPATAYPDLWAWLERVENLPGVAETFPPHWDRST